MVSTMNLCLTVIVIVMSVHVCNARDYQLNQKKSNQMIKTITVNQEGKADFNTIQKAIDSIPSVNNEWIRIFVSQGTYRENIKVPKDKGFIFIEGETTASGSTKIEWDDSSPTLDIQSDNIVLKSLVIKNTYGFSRDEKIKSAVAVRLSGDKYAIHKCSFIGLQNTLWDVSGRHYFKETYISGATDFIWGSGQSIYEDCQLDVSLDKTRGQINEGYITAHGRESADDASGFVFKGCKVTIIGGTSKLGRASKPYSRVIFSQCALSEGVDAAGWDASVSKGHEETITYVEDGNTGEGADTTGRVPWMKRLSNEELSKFTSLSYIDEDGWISKLPSDSMA